jgi:hypothetical protein
LWAVPGVRGSICSYLKIMTVLINDGKGANGARIVEKSTLEEMSRDQIEHIAPELGMERLIQAATPMYTNPVQMMPGVNKGWYVAAASHDFLNVALTRS